MLQLAAATPLAYTIGPLRTGTAAVRTAGFRLDGSTPAPAEMRLAAIKAELDERSVLWRGVCFEREDLERALVDARETPPQAAPPAAPSSPAAGFGDAVAQAEAEAAAVRAMSVDAIRQELDAFGADSAAIADGDKDKLVSELLNARAFSKPHFSPAEGAPSDAAQSPSGGGGTSSPPAPPAPPAPPPPAAADEEGLAEAAYAAALAEAMQMKVKELRGALAARNVGWADCLEKQALRGWGATSRLFSCSLTGTLSCLGAGCGAAGGALAPSSNLPGTLLGARG